MVKSTLPCVSGAGLTVVDEIGRIEHCSGTSQPDILMKRT